MLAMLTSVALAFMLVANTRHTAHAAQALQEIGAPGVEPWGMGFDNNGNEWVAEPACDPNPICASVNTGSIAQVNRGSFSVINNFNEPGSGGFSSPLFVAPDAQGNIWFTEPMSNAIGELIPSSNIWHQFTVPTANAIPFDLAFDQYGHIWFTEILANQIGEFDPTTQTFTETATPTPNSKPYGITRPEPTSGKMWFTENNSATAQIASFTPPAAGSLATSGISEYKTKNGGIGSTPHLISYDAQGDIWWTEGPDGYIGELVISQAQPGTSQGVNEIGTPANTCVGNTGEHISGIGIDGAGNVWFDDSLGDRIDDYTPGQGFGTAICLPANAHPHDGLGIDDSNSVFISEEFAQKFGKIAQPGISNPPPGIAPPSSTPTPTPSPSPSPTPPPISSSAPVSKLWYFAEGRVGKGFEEFLTIDNPSTTGCAVDIQYSYTMDGSTTPLTKEVIANVAASSRLTESANADLGIGNYAVPAAIVSVKAQIDGATPSCPGVVMERPMYFHGFAGIQSGTDVIGSTALSTNYYFADVPTGADNASFITILNPNGSSATVTASYYANGQKVGTQTTTVSANARGTITPNQVSMPTHVAAVISSTQPIVVERPTYFINGNITGGYDIVGTPALAKDWLFAEGYTSSSTQENLTLANIDPANATANVTITLESRTGAIKAYTLSLNAMSQIIWNVNANNSFPGSTPEVSMEITSTGANIVAQREMYFHYNHTLPNGRVTQGFGGTDVLGQVGPAAHSAYSFAEGYTNVGYNEWLTVQNPTATNITIKVTIVNGYGRVYIAQFPVVAHSRFTQDIAALVIANLAHAGDDHRGYEVSMTVQSLNGTPITVERPMYWNTSGASFPSIGGSDVIGYVGG